ncbi:MAG: hypothetical protein K2W99_03480 [Chthoniobacterales bacterium]|nr:hypothetical protein [Chthoniobacterales bacterium]
MSEKDLIPASPIGEELYARFQQFSFRANPNDAPMARALLSHGYEVTTYPLEPYYTQTDWLASQVVMSDTKIKFRQPTPNDLLVCFVERVSAKRSMASALLGIADFFAFCRDYCPQMDYVGGNISKLLDNPKGFEMDRLIQFYNRFLGGIERYENNGMLSIYAKVHQQERFETFPMWNWRKKKKEAKAF